MLGGKGREELEREAVAGAEGRMEEPETEATARGSGWREGRTGAGDRGQGLR